MKIAIVNESWPIYNLATHKMQVKFRGEGHEVALSPRADFWAMKCDVAYLSSIFTWDLPKLIEDAQLLVSAGIKTEVGGPAVTAMPDLIREKVGIEPKTSLDRRFEHVPGDDYKMVFTSRGCRNHCAWCIVPKIEKENVEYDDFPIPAGSNPYIGDNNILATSWKHQQLVVDRMKDVRNLDINSGFEAELFTEDHYQLYSRLHLEAWRLAFDSMRVEKEFERAVGILKKHGVDYRHILVYVLIGFPGTTFEEAVYRLEKTRALGCSPYPQRFMPLNRVDARSYTARNFDDEKLETLRTYWSVPPTWRTTSWEDYKRNFKSTKNMIQGRFANENETFILEKGNQIKEATTNEHN